MQSNIADDTINQFNTACALQEVKMSQVVAELIEQWLKAKDIHSSNLRARAVIRHKVAK